MKKRKAILVIILFIIGLGIFSYPIISNFYNDNFQTRAIDDYQSVVNSRTKDENEALLKEMNDYNKALATGLLPDEQPMLEPDYEEIEKYGGANIVQDGMDSDFGSMLGVLNIPVINLTVPIFEGIGDFQLQRGVGHIPGTSLPVGGEGAHSVLTGHRGLPTAKLFSDLPKVKIGDQFFIEVLETKLAYEVREINVIEPTQIGELKIMPGEDLVTLLTCTPYMVNSHRLIVTGARIPWVEDVIKMLPTTGDTQQTASCCPIMLLLLLLILITLLFLTRKASQIYKLTRLDCQKKYPEEFVKHKKQKDKPDNTHYKKSSPAGADESPGAQNPPSDDTAAPSIDTDTKT